MKDADKLAYAISYLRRTKTLEQIKALADVVGAAVLSGKSKVTITGSTFEGGSSTGEREWECAITGQACESLIREPTVTASRLRVISHNVAMGPCSYLS
jgi:hypothetical protein